MEGRPHGRRPHRHGFQQEERSVTTRQGKQEGRHWKDYSSAVRGARFKTVLPLVLPRWWCSALWECFRSQVDGRAVVPSGVGRLFFFALVQSFSPGDLFTKDQVSFSDCCRRQNSVELCVLFLGGIVPCILALMMSCCPV